MAKTAAATELLKLVKKLQDERADHVKAIEAIDLTFAQLGIQSEADVVAPAAAAPAKRRGRPAGSKAKTNKVVKAAKPAKSEKTVKKNKTTKKSTKRSRGAFTVSGDDSVLGFIKANANCTTAQVNDHWTTEGRAGKADNAIGKLVREGKVTRKKIKGERGSTYSAK